MKDETATVSQALARVLAGEELDEATLYALADIDSPEGICALLDGAHLITLKYHPAKFDSCSIVNARSGRCSEDCKWCAQSAHYATGCDTYEIVDSELARRTARHNAGLGIGRFSLVGSGRAVKGRTLSAVCSLLKDIADEDGISTCASLGLLNEAELKELRAAGVRRYHCNLETAPSYFSTLVSTHSIADKLDTIATARRLGFEICSGGIIGMGETRRQRMELAITLRSAQPVSIPLNLLNPIPGTPLADVEPMPEEEYPITAALFRFAHPRAQIRFAGGRARLSRNTQLKAMYAGVNGAIIGDLLTTIGSTVAADKELCTEAGYEY